MLIAISDNIDESSSVQAYCMPFTLDVNMYIWCCRLSSNRFQFGFHFQPTTRPRWRIHLYENCQCCWLSMIYGLVETRHPVWYNWVHPKNSIISRTWLEVILDYRSPFFGKKNENRTRIPLEVSMKKEGKTEEAFTSVSQCFCCSSNSIFYFHIAAFTYKLQVFFLVFNLRYRSSVQVHKSCLTSNIGDSHMTVSSTR